MSTSRLTKKQKKGIAFRERKLKKNTDILAEDEDAVPVVDVLEHEDEPVNKDEPMEVRLGDDTGKMRGEVGKKRKREVIETAKDGKDADENLEDASMKKGKKRKLTEGDEKKNGKVAPGKTRFILFVGNLKYTTSVTEIEEHFAICDPPPTVRLLTPKPKSPGAQNTAKSKGCAFLEFSHRNALQQGLKLHGSTLDGRRINVELTAGGGGKSEGRVQKVQARNKQLLEERKARVQKKLEAGDQPDISLTAPPQRHSTTSGVEGVPKDKRTWTVAEHGEESGRGGVKRAGKKGKAKVRSWATGANSIAVG